MSSTEQNTNKDSQPAPANNSQSDNTYYERKKNIISGIDNGHLGVGLGLVGIAVGLFASMPLIKNAWENFNNNRAQQQNQQQQLPPPPPQVEEPYIPPTPPQIAPPANGHAEQPVQSTEQPTEQTAQPTTEQQQEDDGVFYEQELRRRQKLMGQKGRGSRYDSPFGKDIGGL